MQANFSHIIDVRSLREFAYSHIPNALNFAVLDDDEFEKIGTLYKTDSFGAKVLGASLVSKNIAKHLLQLKEIISPKKPFLIHCARGGMRSQSLYMVLNAIGYQVFLLEGGYKSYRKIVTSYLQSQMPHQFITLVGQSGSGKSEILSHFKNALDIENIAKHLGSSFGGILGHQPSVKHFQNLLFTALKNLENAPFVLVECESKKLGNLVLPSTLYNAYQNAPKILIIAPLEQRIQRICQQYGKISPAFFEKSMQKITPFIKREFWKEAKDSYYRGDLKKVAEILLLEYYDKVYKKESFLHSITFCNIKQVKQEIIAFAKDFYKIKEYFG